MKTVVALALCAVVCSAILGCAVEPGPQGPRGVPGPVGPQGPQGEPGVSGEGMLAGSRLRPRYLMGEDGSRDILDPPWIDTEMNYPCRFRENNFAEDDGFFCVPKDYDQYYGAYLDSSCTQPVIYTMFASQTPPDPYGRPPTDPGFGYVKVGAPVNEPTVLYDRTPDACVQSPTDTMGLFVFAVELLGPDFFVAAEVAAY